MCSIEASFIAVERYFDPSIILSLSTGGILRENSKENDGAKL